MEELRINPSQITTIRIRKKAKSLYCYHHPKKDAKSLFGEGRRECWTYTPPFCYYDNITKSVVEESEKYSAEGEILYLNPVVTINFSDKTSIDRYFKTDEELEEFVENNKLREHTAKFGS